ncbi:tyrosine-type recombinase/integrase [Segniliparus rotundus]|uniref:tyrosine-type recombinase/integrase n=1 Tax=Segniliparus rotundus TaxID=286802 RepID=UPI000674163D|nr:tyrosine-type recombinase/integrase [Segniliparus rotundus]
MMSGLLKGALTVGMMAVKSRSVTEIDGLDWKTPKTQERRTGPFPASMSTDLAALMEGKKRPDLVFANSSGDVLRASNWRTRVFKVAVQACRAVDEEFPTITPRDLRHTAASLAVSAGANVKSVQRVLGHTKASMTLGVYSDLFDTGLDLVVDNLDTAILAAAGFRTWLENEETPSDQSLA